MKSDTITVVSHSGKEDLKELITKLVLVKIHKEQKLMRYYTNDSNIRSIPNGKQEQKV